MISMNGYKHLAGSGYSGLYITSDDGTLKVTAACLSRDQYNKLYGDIKSYQWNDGDFILSSYPRNGEQPHIL